MTGKVDAIQHAVQVYLQHLESMSASTHEDTLEADAPCGLHDHDCPNECSGNGECLENGCVCKSGFLGYDCSTSGNSIPEFKEVQR